MAETGPAEPEGYTWETAPEPITEVDATEETDVVVIGGGIAGFSAACSAAEKGAKVVLLEKTGAGQFRGIDYGAIGGKLQLEAGIDLRDRKQDVLQEVLRWGDHRGDYRVVKAWVDHSAEALDWAADMLTNHGITIAPIPMEMQVIPDAWYEHYATDAFQIVPTDELIAEGGEAGYEPPFAIGWAKAFTAYAGELGVDVRFNTEALQLVQDEAGAVAGVVCEEQAGVTRIDAKAVVMATGGYGNDEEMMDAFIPGHAEDVHNISTPPHNTGDGIRMGAWVGGAIDEAPHCPMYFDEGVEGLEHMPSIPLTRQPWLYLNDLGERFCNEECIKDWAESGNTGALQKHIFTVIDQDFVEKIHTEGPVTKRTNYFKANEPVPYFQEEIDEALLRENPRVVKADTLEELAEHIKGNALCGLGQTAPNPVLSTMKNFRDEYIAHVVEKRCPAGSCKALLSYTIDPDKCKGCSACSRVCPADAISGVIRSPFKIDTSKCIKCGSCMEKCKFGAISKG